MQAFIPHRLIPFMNRHPVILAVFSRSTFVGNNGVMAKYFY
jgi:hypothetical protein